MKKKKRDHALYCPYCGRRAVLRNADYVYQDRTIDRTRKLYVCSGFPENCDAYVGAHKDTDEPMGTLANGQLRNMRIQAHHSFDRIWKSGIMSRKDAYRWLTTTLGMGVPRAHIGSFNEYLCRKCIRICDEVLKANERRAA